MTEVAREDAQTRIRMPPMLLKAVQAAAKRNGRSMNAEVVAILQDALDVQDIQQDTSIRPILEQMAADLRAIALATRAA